MHSSRVKIDALVDAMEMFFMWDIKPTKHMIVTLACKLTWKRTMDAETYSDMMECLNGLIVKYGLRMEDNKVRYGIKA